MQLVIKEAANHSQQPSEPSCSASARWLLFGAQGQQRSVLTHPPSCSILFLDMSEKFFPLNFCEAFVVMTPCVSRLAFCYLKKKKHTPNKGEGITFY